MSLNSNPSGKSITKAIDLQTTGIEKGETRRTLDLGAILQIISVLDILKVLK
jgi:hypothetical protein